MGRKRKPPRAGTPERNRQFAARLNGLLDSSGLSPKQLADRLGLSAVIVYHYLQGEHLPRIQDLPELAQALGLKTAREVLPEEW
jgi:transcriptional regulator with XRE-family HTH domain